MSTSIPLSQNVVYALGIAFALVSIGVSSYQFQSTSTDFYGEGDWSTTVCAKYPYAYMSPFGVKFDNDDTTYYCGYPAISTGIGLFD